MKFRLLLLFSVFGTLAHTQPEDLVVHLHQDRYLAGEDLYFSAYRTEPDSAQWRSRVLHLVVSNPKGEPVARQRYPLDGAATHGELHLPLGWAQGFYRFHFYTVWNLNYGAARQQVRTVPIYNSLLEPTTRLPPAAEGTRTAKRGGTTRSAPIELQVPAQLAPGETARLTLTAARPTTVSVSITPAERHVDGADFTAQTAPFLPNAERTFSPRYAPETGLVLQGEIRALDTDAPQHTDYLGIRFVEDRRLHWTNAPGGVFRVEPPAFFGERTLQYFDGNPFHPPLVRVKLTPPIVPELTAATERPRRDSTVVDLLKLDRRRRELRQLFGQQPARRSPLPFAPNDVFTPQNVYLTRDYIQFDNLIDFLEEVTLAKRKTKRGYAVSMTLWNPNLSRHFNGPPVYIVDNYLTFNEVDVLRIDYADIESVELFTDLRTLQEQFKLMGANGVVRFTTKSGDLPSSITGAANNYQLEGYHFVQPYVRRPTSGAVPDLQLTLLWAPQVEILPGGTTLDVVANDLPGRYRVTAVGVDTTGTPFRVVEEFEVGTGVR